MHDNNGTLDRLSKGKEQDQEASSQFLGYYVTPSQHITTSNNMNMIATHHNE